MPGNEEDDDQQAESSCPSVPRTRALVEPRLSVLGRNPFTQAHVYTIASLANLQLLDLDVLCEFPHLQWQHDSNLVSAPALGAAAPCGRVAQTNSQKCLCTPSNAWVDGGKWIGSLLRIANRSHNRIERMRDLSQSHQFLQELHLAHNGISTIEGVAQLRFLRVLDLSHNRLTSTRGLMVAATTNESSDNKGLEALETLILSHNQIEAVDLEDVNELNHLMPLRFLQRLVPATGSAELNLKSKVQKSGDAPLPAGTRVNVIVTKKDHRTLWKPSGYTLPHTKAE